MTKGRDSIFTHMRIILVVYSAAGVCVLIGFLGGFILSGLLRPYVPDLVYHVIQSSIFGLGIILALRVGNRLEEVLAHRANLNEPL